MGMMVAGIVTVSELMNDRPIPTELMQSATFVGGNSMLAPRAESTSALPLLLETDRLPCFATVTSAPAHTNEATVEILKVDLFRC